MPPTTPAIVSGVPAISKPIAPPSAAPTTTAAPIPRTCDPRIPVIATESPSPSPRQSPIVYQLPTRASVESGKPTQPIARTALRNFGEGGRRMHRRTRLTLVALISGALAVLVIGSYATADSGKKNVSTGTMSGYFEGAAGGPVSSPCQRFIRGDHRRRGVEDRLHTDVREPRGLGSVRAHPLRTAERQRRRRGISLRRRQQARVPAVRNRDRHGRAG